MGLLREQVKMIAGEVALCMSSLKRLTEQSSSSPGDSRIKEQIKKLKNEIIEKKHQIRILEQRMIGSVEIIPHTLNSAEIYQALSKLTTQLNEKTFELEIKSADNRVLQEQLQMKISENAEMQETILLLRQQLDSISHKGPRYPQQIGEDVVIPSSSSAEHLENDNEGTNKSGSYEETCADENTPTSVMSLNRVFYLEDSKECNDDTLLNSQVTMQAAEIKNLKEDNMKLAEEKDGLEVHSKKMAEEASYAKELAAAAAIELKNLAEEVTKLSYENAKLIGNLAAIKEVHSRSNHSNRSAMYDRKQQNMNGAQYERETALSERDQIESELRKRLDESKRHEEELESELANMWVLVAKMRKSGINAEAGVHALNLSQTVDRNGFLSSGYSFNTSNDNIIDRNMNGISSVEELRDCYEQERRGCKELESLVSRMKGEDIAGLDVVALEELQNLHVEAITKICHAKCTNGVL